MSTPQEKIISIIRNQLQSAQDKYVNAAVKIAQSKAAQAAIEKEKTTDLNDVNSFGSFPTVNPYDAIVTRDSQTFEAAKNERDSVKEAYDFAVDTFIKTI